MKNLILLGLFLFFSLSFGVSANASDRTKELVRAERALSEGDYRTGVTAYLAAANNSDNIETARQATRTAYDFGFDKTATDAARRWSSLNTEALEPKIYEGLAVLRSGDRKSALPIWRRLMESESATAEVCDFIEREGAPGVRIDDFAWLFDRLAARFDDRSCVIAQAASAAARSGDEESADRWLDRLENIGAFDDDARLVRIGLLIDAGDSEAAFTDEALFLSDTASVEQQVQLAMLNARADDIEHAMAMMEFLVQEYPDNDDVMEGMAVVQLQAGDLEASRESFLNLLESSAEKAGAALYYLARFAEGQRRFDQALRFYSQVDQGDYVLDAQQRAATLVEERSGFLDALEHLEGFVERNPRHGLGLSLVRASLYAQNEFYDESLTLFDEYLDIKPRAEFALLGRADALLRQGELDAAIDGFRAVVDLYPKSSNALNSLGYTLADRTRKFREAERLIDTALEMDPENPAIIDSKGWVLFRRGKLKEAREYLERAYEDFPDAEVAAHLGEVMWRMGDQDAARELLEEAYRRSPQDQVLRDTISRLMDEAPATRS